MNSKNTFFKNGFVLTVATIVIKTISIVFSIFLSNVISSSDLGCFSVIMSIFSFLLTIALSGVNLSSTRLVSVAYSCGNLDGIRKIMRSCLIYCLFFSCVSVFALFLFKNYILGFLSQKSLGIGLIYFIAISLPFCSVCSCFSGYFMAMDKIKNLIISQTLEIVVQVLLSVFFYKFGLFNSTYSICKYLIIGIVVSDILSALYCVYTYFKDLSKFRSTSSIGSNCYMTKIIKISLPVALTSYIKSGLSTLKTSLIPIAFVKYGLTNDEALGYYGLISGTVLALMLFPFTLIQSYNSLLVPKISSYNPAKNLRAIKRIIMKSIKLTLVFSIITFAIFAVFADKINKIFYANLDITYYIKIFAPIVVYIYMDNVIDSILKSLDCQVFVVVINIVDVIITTILIYTFIPKFGVTRIYYYIVC